MHRLYETLFGDFSASGYIDASYNYLVRSNQFISYIPNRLNDTEQNGFTLQQASLILSSQPQQGFGWYINPLIGTDANWLAPNGWSTYYGSNTASFMVPQGYLQYTYNALTVMGGIMQPIVGVEDYIPTVNWNFSHGLLNYFAEPGTLIGVRGVYNATKQTTLTMSVINGWNDIKDYGKGRTLELGYAYTFNPALSLYAFGYTGMERVYNNGSGLLGKRRLIELTAKYNPWQRLSFWFSTDYGWQTRALLPDNSTNQAVWKGIAGFINYLLAEQWQASGRIESFYDKNGFTTGVRQTIREITATLRYLPNKHFELRAETRHDFSNRNSFFNRNKVTANNNQQSYALEGLYKF